MELAASPVGSAHPRAPWIGFAAILAVINVHAGLVIGSVQADGMLVAASNLFDLNAVQLFALYGLWTIGQEGARRPDAPGLTRSDMLVVALALTLTLVPWNVAALPALLLLSLWSLRVGTAGSAEQRGGLIMLALAGSTIIARLLLNSVGDKVLILDAQFVGWLAGVPVQGNIVDFQGFEGRSFIIAAGCSSVHNMSQAVLLWATVTQLLRLRIDAMLVGFGLLAMAGMFLVNAVRLTVIAWYPQHFDELHVGTMASLFGLASLIVAALIVAAGALHAHHRQA
jgi:exosortase/archaeosortase family protein